LLEAQPSLARDACARLLSLSGADSGETRLAVAAGLASIARRLLQSGAKRGFRTSQTFLTFAQWCFTATVF
jgi:hypothetical protein